MAARGSASEILQGFRRVLHLQARAISGAAYGNAAGNPRPATVCFLGPPVRKGCLPLDPPPRWACTGCNTAWGCAAVREMKRRLLRFRCRR